MAILQVLIQTVFWTSLSPLVFIPAIALGWWGRSKMVLIAGSAVIVLVQLVLFFTMPLPAGAQRLIWAVPVLALPPFAISFGVQWLRRKLQSEQSRPETKRTTGIFLVAFGVLLGACVGAGVFFALALILTEGLDFSAADGSRDYSLLVIGTPLGLIVGMIVGGRLAFGRIAKTKARAVALAADRRA